MTSGQSARHHLRLAPRTIGEYAPGGVPAAER